MLVFYTPVGGFALEGFSFTVCRCVVVMYCLIDFGLRELSCWLCCFAVDFAKSGLFISLFGWKLLNCYFN